MIKIRNCDERSALRKYVVEVDISRYTTASGFRGAYDLSGGVAQDFILPFAGYLDSIIIHAEGEDFTQSEGITFGVTAVVTSACLVTAKNLFSASSDALGYGSDWTSGEVINYKVDSRKLLSAGSIINFGVSAVSGTDTIIKAAFIFKLDPREEI